MSEQENASGAQVPCISLLSAVVAHPGFERLERKLIALEKGTAIPPSMSRPVTKWGERWEIGIEVRAGSCRLSWAKGDSLDEALRDAEQRGWIAANRETGLETGVRARE
jgi:hypothetical protein